jgi:hypothetical protein
MGWPTNPDDPQEPTAELTQPAAPPPVAPEPPSGGLPAPGQTPATPSGTHPVPDRPVGGQPAPGQPAPGQPSGSHPAPGYPSGPPSGGQPVPGYPAGPPSGSQPAAGYPSGGYPLPGQPSGGQPIPRQPAPGYPSGGYPAPGQPSGGFPAPGQPSGGFPAPGQPFGGYAVPGQPGPGYAGYPTTVQSGPSRKVLLGMVAILAMAAGAFAVVNLTSGGRSGAASPEGAMTGFFDALSDEDVVGMAAMVDPAEREALLPFVEDLESNMSRLAITTDIDLGDVDGLDLEVQGLQVVQQELAPGIVQVNITGGVVTWATEPDRVPIGDALRDIIEANTGEPVTVDATADQESINGGGDPLFLIATETDGRWHLSLAFTIAEYARRDAGMPLPPEGSGVTPQGAESPEAAVQSFVDAVGALDLERMISLLPPDEMRALQRYAPLFMEDAQEEMDEFADDEGFSLTTDGLSFDTTSVDGGTRVVPTAGTITMETDEGGFSFSVADGCVEMTGELGEDFSDEYGDAHVCTGDLEEIDSDLSDEEREALGDLGAIFGEMEPGVVVVERSGGWYVDPLRSVGDLTMQVFAGIAPEDLTEGGVLYRLFTGDVFETDDDSYDDDDDAEAEADVGEDGGGGEGGVTTDDAYYAGYAVGYEAGYTAGFTTAPYDDSAGTDVPTGYEFPEDYTIGYYEGYADGYSDGGLDA